MIKKWSVSRYFMEKYNVLFPWNNAEEISIEL